MICRAIARSLSSWGWLSGASARLALACASNWLYCWTAESSSASAGTSRRMPEADPTSTCAATGSTSVPAAASTKARRACQVPPRAAQQRQPASTGNGGTETVGLFMGSSLAARVTACM